MTSQKKADELGISRQVYEYRVKNWSKAVIDGKDAYVNPTKIMYVPEGDKCKKTK